MKKKKLCRLLPTFIIVVTLYLPDPIHTMAAEPSAVSENTLPDAPISISENTLPQEPISISENTLPQKSPSVSENTLPDATTAEPDCISSAAELTGWLNSHMYSGGRASLTENITFDSPYNFVPYPNLPPLFVETGGHSIFVRADVELWSDGHFTFSGTGSAQGIFHVEKGCSLLLDGVTVETPAESDASLYTLWQEEGASLTVGNTFAPSLIKGNIHYADTPFVTDTDPVCVVVEQGQLLDEKLPAVINCRVNYQGTYLYHEPVAVVWDITDTQKQQNERQRFQAQGVFPKACSNENPVCTVVYHDYPLTFTRAEAFIRKSAYTFRGEYIKQEKALTAAASPEYSFDGQNWIREGENNTLSADNGFYISFPCDQWDTATHPYIHIRLRADTGNQTYYSNVLRYSANNLDIEEDLGGSRGGGTAVVNPPETPDGQKKPAIPKPSAESDKTIESNVPADSINQEEFESSQNPDQPAASQNRTVTPAAETTKAVSEPAQADAGIEPVGGIKQEDAAISETPIAGVTAERTEGDPILSESTLLSTNEYGMPAHQTKKLILAAGFVLLSAAAGMICFFIIHSGTGDFQKRKSASSGGTNK